MPELNSGDTAWVLPRRALVLFMTPDCVFYGGLSVTKTSSGPICRASSSWGWWAYTGWSSATRWPFGPERQRLGIIGNLDHFGLKMSARSVTQAGPDPAEAFHDLPGDVRDHYTALITGAFAERAKIRAVPYLHGGVVRSSAPVATGLRGPILDSSSVQGWTSRRDGDSRHAERGRASAASSRRRKGSR